MYFRNKTKLKNLDMKKSVMLLSLALAWGGISPSLAQRHSDKLARGLVAIPARYKTVGGNFLSWRIFGEEYYDTKYNVYRDGTKLNDEPLSVSNFSDTNGTTSSTYTVAPVIGGV